LKLRNGSPNRLIWNKNTCKPKTKVNNPIDTTKESEQKAKNKDANEYYCSCMSDGYLPDKVCTAAVNSEDKFDGAVWDKNCSK